MKSDQKSQNIYKEEFLRPDYKVTYQELLKAGFSPVVVDVMLLEKDLNDSVAHRFFLETL